MLRVTILLLLLLLPSAVHAQKRAALVIGNSSYRYAGELANPKNDATDMAAALRAHGFQVVQGLDLDKTGLERKLREFATALQGAQVGVFFYAGHGLQVSGENYIVPIDAQLTTLAALELEVMRFEAVQRIMENEDRTNILFFDACRDNPLARNLKQAMGTRSTAIGRGLAEIQTGQGTLISYSTAPGNVALDGAGRNSPFTGALIRHLSSSNEEIMGLLRDVRNDVLRETQRRQRPWESSGLTERFYFKAPPNLVVPQPQPNVADRAERVAFLVEQGAAALQRGDFDRAIADYSEVLRLDPKFALAFAGRGTAYGNKNDFDRAIADHDEAIRLDPKLAVAFNYRGVAYAGKKDFDRAISDYSEAIRLDPKYTNQLILRGIAYESKNDFDRAIDDYSEAIRLDPNLAIAFKNRGNVYFRKKDFDRAIADYSDAIRLNPKFADALTSRGAAYEWKNDFDRAIADHDEAIRLDPNLALAFNNRGVVYERKNNLDRAISDYSEAIRLDPTYASPLYNRGKVKLKKGDTQGGNADVAAAKRLNPAVGN